MFAEPIMTDSMKTEPMASEPEPLESQCITVATLSLCADWKVSSKSY